MDATRLFLIGALMLPRIESSKLIFFLVDGFRWDYFQLHDLRMKGFTRLFQQGTRAEWMVPDFPTNSVPNYKTLETGLHVENHGMVGNYMYDETSGNHFKLSLDNPASFDPTWWNRSESFFITAEKQGIRTGLYNVRGCNIEIDSTVPTFCLPYTKIPSKVETDWAISDALEKMRDDKLDIAYIYHENVDSMGHYHGPNSKQVHHAVEEVDNHIDKMLDIIEGRNQDNVDVIVLSDHGMSTIDKLHKINITEALDMRYIKEITEGGTQVYIWPESGKGKHVYDKLKSFHRHLRVYLRDEIIDRWFFKKHSLIPPIYLTSDKGWYIVHPKSPAGYFDSTENLMLGNHGFDNDDHDMRSIFLAYGPDFRDGYIAKPFSNVNVYQIICYVTGINARANNGTWSEVKDMLVDRKQHSEL
ncbi:glycerophosphocholine cholinephosphodiesterase ENPP6-like [Mercenaria mercenaria]|uniref:glycerophosphocholine cholinephosphodiesterase ENPP6-like n=1 Tax=Mercenaria mercenaria TaxID=6596 RepID=UPI00234F5FAA|nr:glycerophosphocholine cholinephosphodiesterase ENPP6-like [Mercenaria mercenaria]